MKKPVILFIFGIFFAVTFVPRADAFWIWSPKKQKWSNPEMSPLSSPKAQLDRAMEIYNGARYAEAKKEFAKIAIHFKDAKEAPEAKYFEGACWAKMGQPYKAFLSYKAVVESYPTSTRISEAIKNMFALAEELITERAGRKVAGIRVDHLTESPAIEIYNFIIVNAPYSDEAKAAQYKLGQLYKNIGRLREAIDAFKEVIDKYPESVRPGKI
jgi:TolA-binding protein